MTDQDISPLGRLRRFADYAEPNVFMPDDARVVLAEIERLKDDAMVTEQVRVELLARAEAAEAALAQAHRAGIEEAAKVLAAQANALQTAAYPTGTLSTHTPEIMLWRKAAAIVLALPSRGGTAANGASEHRDEHLLRRMPGSCPSRPRCPRHQGRVIRCHDMLARSATIRTASRSGSTRSRRSVAPRT